MYDIRFAAFIDILGFSDIVHRLENEPTLSEKLVAALRKIRQKAPPRPHQTTDLRGQNFSDSLFLSAAYSADGFWHIASVLYELTQELLQMDVLVRGAISLGPVFHDDDVVFGKGLLKAYALESKCALYPRIIIAREADTARRALSSDSHWAIFSFYIKSDCDGFSSIDYLHDLGSALSQLESADELGGAECISRAKPIHEAIASRLSHPSESVRQKARWLAQYWNETVCRRHSGSLVHKFDLP